MGVKNPGTYAMKRGWLDSDVWDKSPYSEREAWCWMIGEAAWKNKEIPVRGKPLHLRRGQLYSSVRFMADKFQWSTNRVLRFLEKLKNFKMIVVQTETGQNLITICNYEEYQFGGDTDGDSNGDTDGDTSGDSNGDKQEEINKSRTQEDTVADHARAPEENSVIERAKNERWGDRIAEVTGWADSPNWFGNYSRLYVWIEKGWSFHEDILPTIERVMSKRRSRGPPGTLAYFERAIADAHATRTAPLPKGEPQHAKPAYGANNALDAHARAFDRAAAIFAVQRGEGVLDPAAEGDSAAGSGRDDLLPFG